MSFIVGVLSLIGAVIFAFRGEVVYSIQLMLVAGLFFISFNVSVMGLHLKELRDMLKDKILAEKTMAALYKAAKTKEDDGR